MPEKQEHSTHTLAMTASVRKPSQSNFGIGTPGMEFHVEWGETTTMDGTTFNFFRRCERRVHYNYGVVDYEI